MTRKKVIAICQSGGKFEKDKDGAFSYKGGDAHAMEIDDELTFNDIKMEVAEMFNCSIISISIKYFLPGNRKTLISISNNKDLKRMIKFHGNCNTADIFIVTEEAVGPDVSGMLVSRSSRTSLSEAGVLLDAPPIVGDDIMDDSSGPSLMFDANFDVMDDCTNIDALLDASTDMPLPPFPPLVASSDRKHVKAAQQWQKNITGVGQRFNSVQEFREALRKYAIAHQFAFKYKKNDCNRVTVKCKAEGCPWRIHASRLSTTQLICIKKMNSTHMCEGNVGTMGYQATRSWVASVIKEKLRVFPNYKPKDIVEDIKKDYGVQLNYFQAWRGKEVAKEQLQGSYKDAYGQLPIFCETIMETNPGSRAIFTTKEDSSFDRLFVSFQASVYGFQKGCRPLLFLDCVSLNSKYQGMLLAATAADGNEGFFPVAFAIVDTETDENWHWFLVQLKSVLSTFNGLTLVADREKGLKDSILEIFQNDHVYHGYCLHYLSEQLIRDLKGPFSHEAKLLMVEDLSAAARAPKPDGFQRSVERIKRISPEAYNWVMQSEPTNWANAFFLGSRYNHMSSNFGELFYSWASEAHELPITQMVDVIRSKIMNLIYTRRVESDQWRTWLTPFAEEQLEKESVKVGSLTLLITADKRFEVRGDSIEIVDIDHFDCSCKEWQLIGLPCCHAIAIIRRLNRDLYQYCARYFTTENFKLTYSQSLYPILNVDRPVIDFSPSEVSVTVTPPPTRPVGRPTSKKFGPKEVVKRQLQCSRCKGAGHNKSTCKDLLE